MIETLRRPVPETRITFKPGKFRFGFSIAFAGHPVHYKMDTFRTLKDLLEWCDNHHEMIWEQPDAANAECLLVSRAYVPGSVQDRLTFK